MRTRNSIKNTIGSMLSNITTIVVGLIAQAIFIKILGEEYLGINGLFTNIISMLGIVELGIGSAIIYNLYKPIAKNEKEKIKSLMQFYKKSYSIIAIIILIIGLLIMPFLDFFVDDVSVNINIYIVFLLFIIDIVCSYLLSYKRSILIADQKNYIINIIHIAYVVIMNIIQIIILLLTKNFYLYLIVKIVMRILENIVITSYVNKKYKYLTDKNIEALDKEVEKDIFTKIKALFFHKVSSFIISGTDNIIIAKFIGIVSVGLYSNYYLIINAIKTLITQMINSTTSSIGNLLVTENKTKCYEVFKRIRFINFWLSCFSSVAILVIMDSFITIWIGEKYILSLLVLIVLVINLYQKLMRSAYLSFKEAAGIFHEDRFVPIVESVLNIVASIVLLKIFGLAGVFMGTIISGFALWFYSYPKYVYKKLFDRKYIDYIKETLGYISLFLIIGTITYLISKTIVIDNKYLQFTSNTIISLLIPNILMLIVFNKSEELKYYKKLLKRMVKKNEK